MNTPTRSNPFAAHDPYGARDPQFGASMAPPNPAAGAGTNAGNNAGNNAGADVVFDVTEVDFEQAVLAQSMEVPVLLDCWAPWCGPCKALGPMLEKLAREYGGRFLLAKLNTDEAPNISAALQLRSIPMVMLLMGGRQVDQFTGALPEGQIRAFLDKHLPAAGPQISPIDELRQNAAKAPDPGQAELYLRQALKLEPGHPEVGMDLAEHLMAQGESVEATQLLETVPATSADGKHNSRREALIKRMQLAAKRPPGDALALAARIKTNPRDFEARFELAAIQAYEGDFSAAFEQLLDVVLRDKADDREKARLQLVEWFDLCPDAEAVSKGRRYLGMYLN